MDEALNIATNELKQTICRHLKELRQERGFDNNSQFGEISSISRGYLDLIDKGRANFTLKKLVQLAAALDVEPYQLLIPYSDEDADR